MKQLFFDYFGWRVHAGIVGYFAWDLRRGWNGRHLHGRTQAEIKDKIRKRSQRPSVEQKGRES